MAWHAEGRIRERGTRVREDRARRGRVGAVPWAGTQPDRRGAVRRLQLLRLRDAEAAVPPRHRAAPRRGRGRRGDAAHRVGGGRHCQHGHVPAGGGPKADAGGRRGREAGVPERPPRDLLHPQEGGRRRPVPRPRP